MVGWSNNKIQNSGIQNHNCTSYFPNLCWHVEAKQSNRRYLGQEWSSCQCSRKEWWYTTYQKRGKLSWMMNQYCTTGCQVSLITLLSHRLRSLKNLQGGRMRRHTISWGAMRKLTVCWIRMLALMRKTSPKKLSPWTSRYMLSWCDLTGTCITSCVMHLSIYPLIVSCCT